MYLLLSGPGTSLARRIALCSIQPFCHPHPQIKCTLKKELVIERFLVAWLQNILERHRRSIGPHGKVEYLLDSFLDTGGYYSILGS